MSIDGFFGKTGNDAWSSTPVKMDKILADINPIVADATTARCIDFHPTTLDRVRCLYQAGKVKITNVEIVGDGIDVVYQKRELD